MVDIAAWFVTIKQKGFLVVAVKMTPFFFFLKLFRKLDLAKFSGLFRTKFLQSFDFARFA